MQHVDKGYVYRQLNQYPATGTSFPVLEQGGAGMQLISIRPGEILTPHWHPNANETTYCLQGEGQVGLVIPESTQKEPALAGFDEYTFCQGDIVFLPQGYAHYFANTGKEHFDILLTFDNPDFDILTLAETIQVLPPNIVAAAESTVDPTGKENLAATEILVKYEC
ncbi:MAG: cupin domain-containing protein [Holophagales bacterium]|nr:cupin domain-containing protein [Holophagales bacterium]